MEFNKTKEKPEDRKKVNFAGGEAFKPATPEMGLYKLVINNLLENKYYENDKESLQRIINQFDAVANDNPEFVLKLADYARNQMYLRDISQLLLVLSSKHTKTRELVPEYAPKIISRADELCTVIAIHKNLFGMPINNYLIEGVREAFGNSNNIPDELESTFVSVDLSGSMEETLSKRSNMTYREISALFGAVLKSKGADVSAFACDFELVEAHHKTPILELVKSILNMDVGFSTNGWKSIKYLNDNEKKYDRIVLLTDMQIWDSTSWEVNGGNTVKNEFEKYKRNINPDAKLYMIDLSSYGDLVTPEGYQGVYNISGWTSKIIDFILYSENQEKILQEIKKWRE